MLQTRDIPLTLNLLSIDFDSKGTLIIACKWQKHTFSNSICNFLDNVNFTHKTNKIFNLVANKHRYPQISFELGVFVHSGYATQPDLSYFTRVKLAWSRKSISNSGKNMSRNVQNKSVASTISDSWNSICIHNIISIFVAG